MRSNTTPEVRIPIEIVGHGERTVCLSADPKLLTIVGRGDDEDSAPG